MGLIMEFELTGEVKIPPHLREIYKSMDLDPDEFLKTEEEKQQDQEAQKQAMIEQMQIEQAMKNDGSTGEEAAIDADGREHQAGLDMMEREHQAELKEREDERGFAKDVAIEAMRMMGKEQGVSS